MTRWHEDWEEHWLPRWLIWSVLTFIIWVCNIVALTHHFALFSKGSTTEFPYECRIYTYYNGVYTEYTPKLVNTTKSIWTIWPARSSPDENPCCTNSRKRKCVLPEEIPASTICCDYSKNYKVLYFLVYGMGLTSFLAVLLCLVMLYEGIPRLDCVGRLAFLTMYVSVGFYIIAAFVAMFEDGDILSMPESDYGISWDGHYKKKTGGGYNSLFCMLICYFLWNVPAVLLEFGACIGRLFPIPNKGYSLCAEFEMWRLLMCEPLFVLYYWLTCGCMRSKGRDNGGGRVDNRFGIETELGSTF